MNNKYIFLENLSLLLKNGYSLQDALNICNYICPNDEIENIQNSLMSGETIENSLLHSRLPSLFKEYFLFFQNKASLSEAIEKSMNICKLQEHYFNKIKKELTYPLILIIFIFLFSIFVVFILLPKVNELFYSFNMNFNWFIRFLLNIFYCIPSIIIIIIFILFLFLTVLLYSLKFKKIQLLEKFMYFPVINIYIKKYFSLKFAIYYNELLKQNIDNNTIIDILNEQLRESDIKIVLYEIKNKMIEGELLEEILKECIFFDELAIIFFKMNFHHNNLSLNHYIEIAYQQIERAIKKLIHFFVTFVYIFVAVFVLIIYISIIIPMMNVISTL